MPTALTGEHVDALFEDLEIEGATVHGASFESCRFSRCHLEDLRFEDCRFVDCLLADCDLVNLQLPGSTMLDVVFMRGRAMGVDWVGLRRLTLALRFEDVRMDYANFTGMPLQRTAFERCGLRGAVFTECDLTRASFPGSDLSGAVIRHAALRHTDLRGTRGCRFDPHSCTTSGTLVDVDTALDMLRGLGVRCPDLGG